MTTVGSAPSWGQPPPLLCCITNGYAGLPTERVLRAIADAGYRAVELHANDEPTARYVPERMSEAAVQEAVAQLRIYGLTPVSVAAHTDLSTPAGVAALKLRIDFATAVGARFVTTGTGHTEMADDAERFFAFSDAWVPYAAERRIIIALESHGGVTGSGANARATIERIASDWVRVNYDPANVIYYEGLRPETDLPLVAPYVAHFHVKDSGGQRATWDFPVPGDGTIDFARLFHILRQVDYHGPYSVEMEQHGLTPEEEDTARARAHTFLSQLLAQR